MTTIDTESDDGAWKAYIESVRNIIDIEEREYNKKEDEEE